MESHTGGLDTIFDLYMKVLPEMGGYICNNGVVDLPKVELIMSEIGLIEDEVLAKSRQREKDQQSKRDRRGDDVKQRTCEKMHARMLADYAAPPPAGTFAPAVTAPAPKGAMMRAKEEAQAAEARVYARSAQQL